MHLSNYLINRNIAYSGDHLNEVHAIMETAHGLQGAIKRNNCIKTLIHCYSLLLWTREVGQTWMCKALGLNNGRIKQQKPNMLKASAFDDLDQWRGERKAGEKKKKINSTLMLYFKST